MDEKDLLIIDERGIAVNPEVLQALNTIYNGKVPKSAIKTRPGGQGTVRYAAHTWVTRLLNAVFRMNWDFETLSYQMHKDGSVSAICKLTINTPLSDGTYHQRIVTEIGSWEAYQARNSSKELVFYEDGSPVWTMCDSDRVASAVSRGLVKCVARALNIGLELMEKTPEELITPQNELNMIGNYGLNKGLTREQILEVKGQLGITEANIHERFNEYYTAIHDLAKGKRDGFTFTENLEH